MPGFLFPGRPGGEHDEPLLDMIIARRALPPDAPQAMHDLTRMLAALAGPAEPGELAGEAAVRAAFSRAASPAGVSSAARRPVRHRRTRRSRERSRSRVRLATVMVVAAAGLGSVLAAYIDVLPTPVSRGGDDHRHALAPQRLQQVTGHPVGQFVLVTVELDDVTDVQVFSPSCHRYSIGSARHPNPHGICPPFALACMPGRHH